MAWLQGISSSTAYNNLIWNMNGAALQFLNYDGEPSGDCASTPNLYACPQNQENDVIENNTFIKGLSREDDNNTIGAVQIIHSDLQAGDAPGFIGNNIFRNNILLSNLDPTEFPATMYEFDDNGTGITPTEALTEVASDTWDNNVIIGSGTGNVAAVGTTGSGGGATITYMYTCAEFAMESTVANCINSDPMLVNYSTTQYNTQSLSNFRLGVGSPAIGAGTATGAPSVDIQNLTRPNPPSIGAYDVGSSPPGGTQITSGVQVKGGVKFQ